jgi:hypothetical protein
MFKYGFTILPTKHRKYRDSIASRVGKLVIVVRIWFLVDTSSAFRFYAEELTQDGSQLISYFVRVHAGLGCGSSGRHVNWLLSKGELWWCFITKAFGFWLAVGIETW